MEFFNERDQHTSQQFHSEKLDVGYYFSIGWWCQNMEYTVTWAIYFIESNGEKKKQQQKSGVFINNNIE